MPRTPPQRGRESGFGLTEVMIAIGIIAAALLVLVQQLSIGFRESSANEDRAFAYEKASALLGEVQNAISMGQITTGDELVALADTARQHVLTTRLDPEGLAFAPDHPMSGNVRLQGEWRWARTLQVEPHETAGLYFCRAKIELRDGARWQVAASHALLFSLLPPTDSPDQTHDVYVIACAEAPNLWGDSAELRDRVATACNEIAAQSQAHVRVHWITRLGYGRDPCYLPSINTVRTPDAAVPGAYWLPGRLGGSFAGKSLYQSELIAGSHRTENGFVHGTASLLSSPSPIADRFNHCMRSPVAWRTFAQRVADGADRLEEPPLQILLDDLQQRPERYENAIFLNLHGSALPVPPLRNVSDAAKDPLGRPGVRVVTHPTRIWTPRDVDGNGVDSDTESIELRVHAYLTTGGPSILSEPILVQIHGGNFAGNVNGASQPSLLVRRLVGGIDVNTGKAGFGAYQAFDTTAGDPPTKASSPFEMYYEVGYVGGADPYTWLRLYNTPLVAPVVGTGGLDASARLYGLEHVPAPVTGDFSRDLATPGLGRVYKNTARWRIRIPKEVFANGLLSQTDRVVRVVTRIGSSTNTGVRWPTPIEPLNVSETFTWWTRSRDSVPPTERAQFQGDPRLCPYSDLTSTGATTANGYNTAFDNLVSGLQIATLDWPCLDATKLRDGFGNGFRADAQRLLQLWRDGLQTSGAVFVATGQELVSSLLLGGEIAGVQNGANTTLPLHADYTGGTFASVDTIAPLGSNGACGELVLARGGSSAWWQKPWLGELFPDDLATDWLVQGNLTLTSSPPFRWIARQNATLPGLPYGTSFDLACSSRLDVAGLPTLIATDPLSSLMGLATVSQSSAVPAAPTLEINTAVHLAPPRSLTTTKAISWPTVSGAGSLFSSLLSGLPQSTMKPLEIAWTCAGNDAAASYAWSGSTGRTATLVLWTAPTTPETAASVLPQSLLLGLRGLHAAGSQLARAPVPQVPRVVLFEPKAGELLTDAEEVTLRWNTEWLRFDGQPYSPDYASGYAGDESEVIYRVLWTRDRGRTWLSALTGDDAEPGVYPDSVTERLGDVGQGSESFTFPLPDEVETGEVTFLVEGWRANTRAHSASHRVVVYVRRSNG